MIVLYGSGHFRPGLYFVSIPHTHKQDRCHTDLVFVIDTTHSQKVAPVKKNLEAVISTLDKQKKD